MTEFLKSSGGALSGWAWQPARSFGASPGHLAPDDDDSGADLRALLGYGVTRISDGDALSPAALAGRIVLLTTAHDRVGQDRAEGLRRGLYSLCDADIRPFCAATHRPYPLLELKRAREAGVSLGARHKRLSDALVDAGHMSFSAEGAAGASASASQTCAGLASLLDRILSCQPSAVLVCSDRLAAVELLYAAHACYVGSHLLPLITLSSRMGFAPRGHASFEGMLRAHESPLMGGRGWLQLGLQRAANSAADYERALEHRVSAVEFLHLLGVWRHILTGREVSSLEHLHDHCDQMTHLQWDKARHGLHVAFSLDVLGAPFGCQLQDLGGVLTYLGRTGVCRVLHLISADWSNEDDPAGSTFLPHLIYKLALLREEYSES